MGIAQTCERPESRPRLTGSFNRLNNFFIIPINKIMPSFTFIAPSGKSSKEAPLDQINSAEDLAKIAYETIHQGKPEPKQQQAKRRLWVTLPNFQRASILTRKNYRYAVASSSNHVSRAAAWFEDRARAERRAKHYTKRPNTGGVFVVLDVQGEGV